MEFCVKLANMGTITEKDYENMKKWEHPRSGLLGAAIGIPLLTGGLYHRINGNEDLGNMLTYGGIGSGMGVLAARNNLRDNIDKYEKENNIQTIQGGINES